MKFATVRKSVLWSLLAIAFLTASSCPPDKREILGTGYKRLPFPSNNFAPGQIIEFPKENQNIEIVFDPRFNNNDISYSEGWNVSASDSKAVEGQILGRIGSALGGGVSASKLKNVEITLENTRTGLVQKQDIISTLKGELSDDPQLLETIDYYTENKSKIAVVTSVLIADIVVKESQTSDLSGGVDLSEAEIAEVQKSLGGSFSRSSDSDRLFEGKQLVVGINYDGKMIGLVRR